MITQLVKKYPAKWNPNIYYHVYKSLKLVSPQTDRLTTNTTQNRVLLEKLIVTQLVKEFVPFMKPEGSSMFTRACHWKGRHQRKL